MSERSSSSAATHDPLDTVPHPINCYALVAYIGGHLGDFLNELRRDIEPCTMAPRAHLTLLPPRPLAANVDAAAASRHVGDVLAHLPPLEVSLGNVEIFPVTSVAYLSIDGGFLQLKRLHDHLNTGPVCFAEPFHYHPHVTLAQGLTPEQAVPVHAEAVRRWTAYRGPRFFSAEAFSFVQGNSAKGWIDLAEYSLASALR